MEKKQRKISKPYVPKIVEDSARMKYSRKKQPASRYEIGRLLGKGGFGQCYHAIEIQTKKQYAIKIIDKKSQSMQKNGGSRRLANQILLMQALKHENIVKIFGSFEDDYNFYLVLELCNKISLGDMIKNRGRLTELQIKYFIKQLIRAVAYLKSNKVLHRDIKTHNILLDSHLNIKLADFGLAISQNSKDSQRDSICGTPNYMAPQIVNKEKYSYEIDMWSVGVVTYILFFGTPPFSSKLTKQIYQKIKAVRYQMPTTSRAQISQNGRDFIKRIFVLSPADRLTPDQALSHSFLTESVPSHIPLSCYKSQVSKNQLMRFCKMPHEEVANEKQAKKGSKQQNRHITDYFEKKAGQKMIFHPGRKEKKAKQLCQNQNQDSKREGDVQRIEKNNNDEINSSAKRQGQAWVINMSEDRIKKGAEETIKIKMEAEAEAEADRQRPAQNQIIDTVHKYQVQQESLFENKKINNGEEVSINQWLDNHLNSIYVLEFMNMSHEFGFFYHLSNGVKGILFNDKSCMAVSEQKKLVIYLELINSEYNYCQKLLKKLIRPCNQLNQANNSLIHTNKQGNPTSNLKRPSAEQTKRIVQFKSHQIPEEVGNDLQIMEKLNILRDCSKRSCKKKPSTRGFKEIDMLKSVNLIKKWAHRKLTHEHILVTDQYMQVIFPQGNIYFVKKRSEEILLVNELEGLAKEFTLPSKCKDLTIKQVKQVNVIRRFITHLAQKNKQDAERRRIFSAKAH